MRVIKISVIVQSTHEKDVRNALGRAGAGNIGNYRECQFITKGEAQFMPEEGAEPVLGENLKLEMVPAVQIQTWCLEDQVEEVVRAIKGAHPNEEPGIELVPIEIR